MKKLVASFCLLFLIVVFTSFSSDSSTAFHSIEGTWELVSFNNYNEGDDTPIVVPKSEGYRQVKMYYNGKVMWTRYAPQDSVEWFGYGSYKITDDQLIETLEYASARMMQVLDTLRVFEFDLVLDEDSYSQISVDEDGNKILAENYMRID